MAQCLTCYGLAHLDNDGQTFLCRGMFTGECERPNISDREVSALKDAFFEPPYAGDDEDAERAAAREEYYATHGTCEGCGNEYGDGWSNCTCEMAQPSPSD
jgi:hypothetical protein